MGPLTYKVFNRYFSVRCGTYNSHLHTTLPLKCESINSSCSPLKRKLLLSCIVVAGFSATDRHCTVVAAFSANGPAASVLPFVELIKCSIFTLLSDVGHITHTCTQHRPTQVGLMKIIIFFLENFSLDNLR